ncbi:MAG: response regulator, partial [Balneolaceae bacterium]
ASSGHEAIRMTSELNPDILLMDISLNGEMDGIEAVEEIRKNSSVAVIYLSGNSDKFNYERAKKTGFISYLVKPVTQEDLKEPLLKAAFRGKESQFTPAPEFNREKNTRRRLVNQLG